MSFFSKKQAAHEAFKLFCTPFFTNVVSKPLIYLQAKPVKFLSHGRKVKGYRWQQSSTNKKVMIIHGFASASYKFEKYIISLMNKGYEVLAFDAPAHGKSQGKTVNVIQYKNMIEKAVAKFGPVDMYIAHSFGGLALSLALENMPHDENTKVTLIAPLTETSTTMDKFLEKLGIKDEEIRSEMDSIVLHMSHQTTEWFSIKRAMRNITAKVLWIHDEDDDITPLSDAKLVQEKQFENITFHITKELGHHQIYQDNEVREMVINFL
ncbi:alpha/beta hydrolase [Ferruginibacter sp. SUN002]|uniref:alpha/beta hydrolase n=1 Tax=Ferruginibacter sp. SUN002 TaxID=2937789 RepID=UPI003D3675A8